MFNTVKISARFLRIPISITGIIYVIIGLLVMVNLARSLHDPGRVGSLLVWAVALGGLAFIHFKAYNAVGAMDKILLRSAEWSTLPNILSAVFLIVFLFVLLIAFANVFALAVFLIGLLLYVFLIVASLGSILGKEWFTFHYFTHYSTGFWHLEHKGLSYFVPDGHDQTLAVTSMVLLIIFIIPTLVSVFVLAFKHLVMDGDGSFSLFAEQ